MRGSAKPSAPSTLFRSFDKACGKPSKRPAPFSLRLTEDERRQLSKWAAGVPLGTYIKARLFDENARSLRLRRTVRPTKDGEALAQALALLGQSRLASNLNQLAKAANMGALPVSAETETELQDACDAVRELRGLLVRALGLKPEGGR